MNIQRLMSAVGIAGVVGIVTAGVAYASAQDTASVIAVPLPSSLALLASGIAGLAGVSWWLRRK
jgi:hypothetical protein